MRRELLCACSLLLAGLAVPYGSRADEPRAADTSTTEPWGKRHLPLPLAFELGVFGGIFRPSYRLGLEDLDRIDASPNDARYHQRLRLTGTVGARVGFFPLRFLGAEAEASFAPTKTNTDEKSARLWSVRGSLVLQLPLWRVVPFVLAGVNGTGIASSTLGNDADVGGQFGGGLKVSVTEHFSMRIDARDVMLPAKDWDGFSHSGEYTLGLGYVLGRTRNTTYASPQLIDRDGDGVMDSVDACPDVTGTQSDGCPVMKDTDGDGIPDDRDGCPELAEDRDPQSPDDGCPNLDADVDGVPIPADLCPAEKGTQADGCLPKDLDGDGLIGAADRCPNEPETKNGFEDEDGCPDAVPDDLSKFGGVMKGVQFENGKSDLKASSFAPLDQAAAVLIQYPSLRVRVVGHTDDRGKRELNMQLSQARADAVKTYLATKGITESRVETQGMGPDAPVADNGTPQGRAENRRIELVLLR